jgi:hypothetical protein
MDRQAGCCYQSNPERQIQSQLMGVSDANENRGKVCQISDQRML